MGVYRPLFSVSAGHQYFFDGLWKGLDFLPEPRTRKIIECTNALVRRTINGIALFYDADKSNALRLYAEDANGELRFSFKVYAKDRSFQNYTASLVRKDGEILYLSNRGRDAGVTNTKIRLSKEDYVSLNDFEEVSTLFAEGVLCEKDRSRPDFVVDIFIGHAAGIEWTEREYTFSFNSRQSYLKYHLLGGMNRNNLFIADLDNQVEFEFCGDVVLPGNKPAKVFRSKVSIPVLEMPTARFQLREQGQGTGKVIIKRLPAASEGRLGMEIINGNNEIVSESFINC